MMKTATRTDLINYAYNESDLSDCDRIQRSIDGDPIVKTEFTEIIEIVNLLNVSVPAPSEECINRILSRC